jgi:hypothetical protein
MRLALLAILAACSSEDSTTAPDAAPELHPPNPVGHYELTVTWTAGNCPTTAPYVDTFTVSQGGGGLVFIPESAEELTGAVACTKTVCEADLVENWSNPVQELRSRIAVAHDGSVTGHATLEVYGSTRCTQTADVAGHRR